MKFEATGTLANQSLAPTALGVIPTGIPALGPELGEATLVPPVVTVVYRPFELGPVTPLVGAGLGLLFAYGAHVTNPVLTAASTPDFSIDPSAGLVLQAGLDVRITKDWFARVDAKYIAFMKADATIQHIQMHTTVPFLDTVDVGTATMSVPINPIIVQAGVGADF
jgi:outer membrane protein